MWAVAEFLTAIAYWTAALRVQPIRWHLRRGLRLRAIKGANPGILRYALATNVNSSLDVGGKQVAVLIVGFLLSPAAVGGFRMAQQLAQGVAKFSQMLGRAIFPELMRSRTDEAGERAFATIRWGDEAWLRLEGMCAAAIWDRRERVLRLARDPLGIKPLYITQQNRGIAFASEIRALRVLPGHSFTVDDRAVHEFFSYGHVQTPRSIYREVVSLEPGTVLTIGRDGEASTSRFWGPRLGVHERMSEADWIEETRQRLRETVEHHLVSDVKVGSFMSGRGRFERDHRSNGRAFAHAGQGLHRGLPRQRDRRVRTGTSRGSPASRSRWSCAAKARTRSSLATSASELHWRRRGCARCCARWTRR